ncbi:hypothetical protein CYMTET_28412 [Cymbomonas tetramitiformis]|uniref:F5/8 type C domain-containing protein n=1 Tax=Cymbomonas tetramitiformis TaxID=36881 RepID=A0AAE0FMV0_9CHLO|nr:hypothetical protein CYMTET_28412 [Cymbomonas tetramitiformis]
MLPEEMRRAPLYPGVAFSCSPELGSAETTVLERVFTIDQVVGEAGREGALSADTVKAQVENSLITGGVDMLVMLLEQQRLIDSTCVRGPLGVLSNIFKSLPDTAVPAAIEELNPEDHARIAFSVYDNSTQGTGNHQGRLDSEGAWRPSMGHADVKGAARQWYQLCLGAACTVTAVVTQGNHDENEWVKQYKVKYSTGSTGDTWTHVDGGRVFTGNSDRGTRVRQVFAVPVKATLIRIYPIDWTENAIALRCGVVVQQGGNIAEAGSSMALVLPAARTMLKSIIADADMALGPRVQAMDCMVAMARAVPDLAVKMRCRSDLAHQALPSASALHFRQRLSEHLQAYAAAKVAAPCAELPSAESVPILREALTVEARTWKEHGTNSREVQTFLSLLCMEVTGVSRRAVAHAQKTDSSFCGGLPWSQEACLSQRWEAGLDEVTISKDGRSILPKSSLLPPGASECSELQQVPPGVLRARHGFSSGVHYWEVLCPGDADDCSKLELAVGVVSKALSSEDDHKCLAVLTLGKVVDGEALCLDRWMCTDGMEVDGHGACARTSPVPALMDEGL